MEYFMINEDKNITEENNLIDEDRQEVERLLKIYEYGLQGLPEGYINNNFAFMDTEKHRQLSSKGGKKSGEIRREKAARKRVAIATLDLMLGDTYGVQEEMEDFKAWQRHRRYLKKKREAAGKK